MREREDSAGVEQEVATAPRTRRPGRGAALELGEVATGLGALSDQLKSKLAQPVPLAGGRGGVDQFDDALLGGHGPKCRRRGVGALVSFMTALVEVRVRRRG